MKDNEIVIIKREDADYSDAYEMVSMAFHFAGYDAEHYGQSDWNPLGKFIKPGDKVLLKPNMVTQQNHLQGGGTKCLYTQSEVTAPVIDYVLKALRGEGKIIIADAPVQECNFDEFIITSGYKALVDSYLGRTENVIIELKDLRGIYSCVKRGVHYYTENMNSPGVDIDLGDASMFAGSDTSKLNRLRITNYDPSILKNYHNSSRHVYSISRDVLEADVIISLPKPKTHRKAGVTIALKNSIGMISRKECVPHHTNGSPSHNGDQYQDASFLAWCENCVIDIKNFIAQNWRMPKLAWLFSKSTKILRILQLITFNKPSGDGSWYGNNTICKSIVDINRCIFYGDVNGRLHNKKQRKYIVIADMIISGEHNGPLSPEPKHNGIIALGENPVAFDEVISLLMGIKPEYFRTLHYAKSPSEYDINYHDGKCPLIISNDEKYNAKTPAEIDSADILYFKPGDTWREAFINR